MRKRPFTTSKAASKPSSCCPPALDSILQPHLHPSLFIEHELDVDILDDLGDWLWLAGRLDNIRPLHHQRSQGRRIVLTERMRLHLVWREDVIFVKPLPARMLDEAFRTDTVNASPTLQSRINGFLRAYLLLVQYPSDFHFARDLCLLPESITGWSDWIELVSKKSDLLDNTTHTYSPRFLYGELRLHRIDFLYRFLPRYRMKHLFRSYNYGNATYQGFIKRNFAWLLTAFIYTTVLLTALQLGINTSQLHDDAAFHRAAYAFTVFALVLPLTVLVYGLVASLVMTAYHVQATLAHVRGALANHKEVNPFARAKNQCDCARAPIADGYNILQSPNTCHAKGVISPSATSLFPFHNRLFRPHRLFMPQISLCCQAYTHP